MAFEINNLVIDRALRGFMVNPNTGEVMWDIEEIEDPSLSVSADKTDAVGATGAAIMSFYRAKTMQFTASSSLFNLPLLAAQSGREVDVASVTEKVLSPIYDEIVAEEADTITLTHTPYIPTGDTYGLNYVYRRNKDNGLGDSFQVADAVAEGKFTITGNKITFNTGAVKVGDRFVAIYEYEADGSNGNGASSVKNTANDAPLAGKFILEILCHDPCDKMTKIFAYLVMPNAQLTADFDLGFATDSKHPFAIDANQDYCDPDKVLFNFIVPESGVAA